ncbi:putative protein isoform X1 [Capsicum galapagoense]
MKAIDNFDAPLCFPSCSPFLYAMAFSVRPPYMRSSCFGIFTSSFEVWRNVIQILGVMESGCVEKKKKRVDAVVKQEYGSSARYKATFMAKGFQQKAGFRDRRANNELDCFIQKLICVSSAL